MIRLVALWRSAAFLAWVALLLPVQMLAMRAAPGLSRALPRFFHRGACRILGIRVSVVGEQARTRPVLFVSNHTSYLDITVLGAVLEASFVAKSEIAGWPIFGLLAKLQRSVFVERRVGRARAERSEMRVRLEAGDSLILFPEGTSSDGNRVLRFNSTFFALAEQPIKGAPLVVQPISIAFTRHNGLPIGRDERARFAWYGDMEMVDHLRSVLQSGAIDACVRFHRPVDITGFTSRKEMARYCHDVVASGYGALVSGRDEPDGRSVATPSG